MTIKDINKLIESLPQGAGQISDGYHTFDEIYEHRCLLWIFALQQYYNNHTEILNAVQPACVYRSKLHNDGSGYEGWFILGFKKPLTNIQITYHLPDKYWDLCTFATTLEFAPEWDGHTSEDAIKRLTKIIKDDNCNRL